MYIKRIFKLTINNKQMYSPRLYKYRNSSVLCTTFGSLSHTHILLVQTQTHDVSAPWEKHKQIRFRACLIFLYLYEEGWLKTFSKK